VQKGLTVVTVPWGGLCRHSDRAVHLPEPGTGRTLPAAGGPMLLAYDDAGVTIDGRIEGLQSHAVLRTNLGERQVLYHLPVPLHGDVAQSLRHASWTRDVDLWWENAVSRPAVRGRRDEEDEPGTPLLHFVLGLVGRMKDFETALAESFLPWERVRTLWLRPEEEQDPTMDVLVHHARRHHGRWADIVERPRRLLGRRREQVPLGRVQELDTRCMEWLSRQPGRTIAERAGGRQRILALARHESIDTLENRVHRDLLERSAVAARDYLALNAARRRTVPGGRTTRQAVVEAYGRDCRRLARDMAEAGVAATTGPVRPNYVLLQDNRYRHVWTAWEELRRRDRMLDDLWRWQRRAWSEFGKAACAVALLARPGVELVAASPLHFRSEHLRGEWLTHDDPLLVVADPVAGWVAEILRGDTRDRGIGMAELGAAVLLRVADLEGGAFRYLPVWSVHGPFATEKPGDLVASAGNVHRYHPKRRQLLHGLILQALSAPGDPPFVEVGEHVTLIGFGPADGQLGPGLARLSDVLGSVLEGVR